MKPLNFIQATISAREVLQYDCIALSGNFDT